MEINGPPPPPRPSVPLQLNALAQMRVGQILQAVVVKATVEQIALLQVRDQQLRVQTQAPLTQGQRVEAEVIQLEPKPILKLRTPIPAPDPLAQTVNTAMKQALPKQAGLAPLLANLNALSQSQHKTSNLLPPLITEAIKKVISNMPQRSQVTTATGLREAIKNSGLFLENKLSAPKGGNSGTPTSDVKTSLLQLMAQASATSKTQSQGTAKPVSPTPTVPLPGQPPVAAASAATRVVPQTATQTSGLTTPLATLIAGEPTLPAPPQRPAKPQAQAKVPPTTSGMNNLLQILGEVGKQAEGALARLSLLQLTSLPQQDQSNSLWFFELPVQDNEKTDIFQLIVEEEDQQQDDSKNKQWGIMLSFDLDNLGPMYVKLNYLNEQISATVWAENSKKAEFVNRELGELSKRFEKAGVEIGNLHCQQGAPSETEIASVNQTVLDISV